MRNSIIRWSILTLALAAVGAGCGGPLRYTLKGTPKAPEADATVVADVDDKTSIAHLTIKCEHLAPPDRLSPGATAYVVWARKNDSGPWTRVGALQYDDGTRKGELKEASVPLTAFDLVITLEKQPAPESPSPDIAISQRVQE
jgi:hypothetical protein